MITLDFNGGFAVEVKAWMIYYTPQFYKHVISYPCQYQG